MSKKRLHKKNIKTKKIRGGNGSNLSSLASQVQSVGSNLGTTAQSVGSNLGTTTQGLENSLGTTAQSVGSNLGTTAQGLANSVEQSVTNTAQSVATNVVNQALTSLPTEKIGLASKVFSGIKNISLKVPLSPEDKFSQALLKLRTNPQFSAYFTTTINQVIVSEFYKVLNQLGQYSKHYSNSVKKIVEITGEFIYDEDDNLYSDLSFGTNHREEPPKCDDDTIENEVDNTNLDKITEDENINYLLEKAMMIHVPAIEEIFKKLKNAINKYKMLRNRMKSSLEKAERENDAETYLEDFRHLSNEATGLIDAIFYEFDTRKLTGGAICPSENKEPTMPLNANDYKTQALLFHPDKNLDCVDDSTKKFQKLNELYQEMKEADESNKKNITNVVDVFNDSMLYMCIRGRKKFSQTLKQKLAGILNKIINRLYEIANAKNIIDDEEEIAPTFLETKGETNNFDIREYEKNISNKLNELKDKVEELEIQKKELDKKKDENIENINQNLKNIIPFKPANNSIRTADLNLHMFKGGANILLPKKYREQANTMLDNLSFNGSLIESENDNLEIVKFQKIVVKIVKKLFCKILEKTDIDLEPFKEIVRPAFKEKQKEFRNLEKIWAKDLKEKKDLIKKIGTNAVVNDEIKNYVDDVEEEIKWAITNQKSIKEYVKSDKEKENEKEKGIAGGTQKFHNRKSSFPKTRRI